MLNLNFNVSQLNYNFKSVTQIPYFVSISELQQTTVVLQSPGHFCGRLTAQTYALVYVLESKRCLLKTKNSYAQLHCKLRIWGTFYSVLRSCKHIRVSSRLKRPHVCQVLVARLLTSLVYKSSWLKFLSIKGPKIFFYLNRIFWDSFIICESVPSLDIYCHEIKV